MTEPGFKPRQSDPNPFTLNRRATLPPFGALDYVLGRPEGIEEERVAANSASVNACLSVRGGLA